MTTIEVYPSNLPGAPLEVHQVDGGTLHDWLTANCPSYQSGPLQPISASVAGVVVPPEQWGELVLTGQTVELRPNPGDPVTALWVAGGLLFGAFVLSALMRPDVPKYSSGPQGSELRSADLQANTPRLNGVIPEIAGRHRVFPDYLCQPRRYFVDSRTEAIDAMLCIGVGEFSINANEIFIGDTPLSTLGDEVSYNIFGPGASVAGDPAHRNWHNVAEVGYTRSSAGLRLIDEDPDDPTGEPSTITGSIPVSLNWAASPKSFSINYDSVTLNQDYEDSAALLASVNAQLNQNKLAASIDGSGALVVSEVYPFSGVAITSTGNIDDVFGTPTYVTGEISTGLWLGPFRLTPGSESTSQIEFNVFAPQGLGRMEDDGSISEVTRSVELQWRANGGAWQSVTKSATGNSRDQQGWTFAAALGASYSNVDVRMRRVGAESKDSKDLDRLEWYGMRCLLPSATSYAGVTTMAITLQGTDRISSTSENQLNLIVTRKLNGTATRSIDDWVRYVCTDIGYSASDLNESELSALATVWDGRGDWFDHVTLDQTTVKDALATALRAGFAELTIDAGKIRPVRDQARTTFEHLYTPQNMVSTLRRQFTAYDPDDFDGVDVEFTSSTSWEQEVVQCRLPGDAGLRVEKIRLEGVTDRTRAWRIGMRQRRAHVYRRKNYSFSTEWDALNSRYLSYCALSDDVPGYGQSAVLLGTASVTGGLVLTVSEPLTWTEGASHVVALRRPDGTLCGPHAATRIADDQVQIAAALDFAPILGGASDPTHVLFGTSTTWSYPVLITEISPAGDTVDVSAVNYDARVYADDDNAPT